MDKCDNNRDGKLDFDEFIQCTINQQSLFNKSNTEKIFKIFDLDGTGKINISEIRSMFSNEAQKDKLKVVLDIFMAFDKNHDKSIDKEEFEECVSEFMKRK